MSSMKYFKETYLFSLDWFPNWFTIFSLVYFERIRMPIDWATLFSSFYLKIFFSRNKTSLHGRDLKLRTYIHSLFSWYACFISNLQSLSHYFLRDKNLLQRIIIINYYYYLFLIWHIALMISNFFFVLCLNPVFILFAD